ncbi:hypothetical protein ASD97_14005 [Streptomyces sp. Root63]|nr:hypothetical protein ASD29_19175 [Streptomyces sp. Root1295]KRA40864.1 hypothetical protein ASD97_14005 [Streptomyces sp. Root63]
MIGAQLRVLRWLRLIRALRWFRVRGLFWWFRWFRVRGSLRWFRMFRVVLRAHELTRPAA